MDEPKAHGGRPASGLLGREAELSLIDGLLQAARKGSSGSLIIRGEAGIGKTALCHHAREQATDMQVLRVRGLDSESEIAFLGLADLLRPLIGLLPAIPPPQAAALSGALGLDASVPVERYAVSAGTLTLLAVAAEEGPVLVIVDDAQWLDASSLDALTFTARRLEAEGVVALFAVRDGEGHPVEAAAIPELRLRGLERDAASELLERAGGEPLPPALLDRVIAATGGNPLALQELPRLLRPDEFLAPGPLAEPVPVGPILAKAFGRHVSALPDATRRALLLAAANETGEMEVVAPALGVLGLQMSDLEPAEEEGLVSIRGGVLEFRHPLLRSTVYHDAAAPARRAAHRALASVLDHIPESRAWHLASSLVEPSEEAAAALEQVARAGRHRAGHAGAADAFAAAARLSADSSARARRLYEAALDAQLCGKSEWAAQLLGSALELVADPLLTADITRLLAGTERFRGSPRRAVELLVSGAYDVEASDRPRAATMLMEAALTYSVRGNLPGAADLARQACLLGRGGPEAIHTLATGWLGTVELMMGDSPPTPYRLGMAMPSLVGDPSLPPGLQFALAGGLPDLVWSEEHDQARRMLARVIGGARSASTIWALPYPLATLADLEFRTGDWQAAYAAACESVTLAAEAGQHATRAWGLPFMARIEGATGREEACRGHVREALSLARELDVGSASSMAKVALGLLELSIGEPRAAVEILEEARTQLAEQGMRHPGVAPFGADLVEAHLRSGDAGRAGEALSDLQQRAERTRCLWAKAAAARCRGLLAPEDEFEGHYAAALDWHGRLPMPFEQARTELCLGERLRRAGRRSEARSHLRAALVTFERLGADPWAARARGEIGASGQTARRRTSATLANLTPQELQVSLQVGEGKTNKEVAAALFLSPKTVEAHLARAYRKLGLRSRTDLVRVLASRVES